jgi:hypothetical protein
MFRLKVTPVVGLPQFTGWSQVAENAISASARLICVYAVSGKNAGGVGRDVAKEIANFYFYDVEQFHEFIDSIIEFVHDNDCRLYISCAVLSRRTSTFAVYGGAIFLKRKHKIGKILASESSVRIVQGNHEEGDVFVLTTLQADQFLSEIEQKFIQGYDVDIIITSIVPGLHSQDDSSLSALVFINQDNDVGEVENNVGTERVIGSEIGDKVGNGIGDSTESEQSLPPMLDDTSDFEEEKIDFSSQEPSGPVSFIKDDENDVDNFDEIRASGKIKAKILISKLTALAVLMKKNSLPLLQKAVSKIKTFRKSDIRQRLLSLNPFKKKVSLEENGLKKRKFKLFLILLIGLIITVALITSVVKKNQERERISTLLHPIQAQYNDARDLVDDDTIQAREELAILIQELESLESQNARSSSAGMIVAQKQEISEFLSSISGQTEMDNLDIFYDLRLVKSDFIASGIDYGQGGLLIYDQGKKEVLLLELPNKQVFLREFHDRLNLLDATITGDEIFILSDGIYSYSYEEKTGLDEVRVKGDSNEDASFLGVYERFVYVVNPVKRNIYRYSKTEDGYSEPIGWVRSAAGVQYSNITSFSIDGSIWITTSGGQLRKFASGVEEVFDIRGLQESFGNDIYNYTNLELENLYILDSENRRIVILSKTGDFIKEISSPSLAGTTALVASEELNKIFVISGSIIYEVEI